MSKWLINIEWFIWASQFGITKCTYMISLNGSCKWVYTNWQSQTPTTFLLPLGNSMSHTTTLLMFCFDNPYDCGKPNQASTIHIKMFNHNSRGTPITTASRYHRDALCFRNGAAWATGCGGPGDTRSGHLLMKHVSLIWPEMTLELVRVDRSSLIDLICTQVTSLVCCKRGWNRSP